MSTSTAATAASGVKTPALAASGKRPKGRAFQAMPFLRNIYKQFIEGHRLRRSAFLRALAARLYYAHR